MLSRKLIKKQSGRRPLAALAVVGLLGSLLLASGTALAVHDFKFQLDGETTTTGYSLPAPGTQPTDWNSLFTATGGDEAGAFNPAAPPPGTDRFTHGDFTRDFGVRVSAQDNCSLTNTTSTTFCTKDTTTFATGSKDTLNISGWQCNQDNNVNSKIDIMNAYAAAYTAANGDKLVYFGMEKNKDVGTNNVGFWFLQGNASCVSTGAAVTFSGTHAVGDVLVVSEFSNGGGVSNITAYRWVGGANPLVLFGQGGDCKTTSGDDVLCATTNAFSTNPDSPASLPWNQTVTTKWKTADATLGVGNSVVSPNFFEGGINLTRAFALSGGGAAPSCFNTFIGDTRSSTSPTATLFDFARGTLGQCAASITTQASTNSTTVLPGTIVTDTATITGTSSGTPPVPSSNESVGGTNVKFYICEVLASGDCTSTAVQVGNAEGEELSATGTPGQASATSDGYDTTNKAVGRYCFYAVWPGDTNYATGAAGGAAATECFTIAKIPTTTVTTPGTLSAATPPVFTPVTTITLGSSVVDQAVVTGTVAGGDPTGSVTFFVCGPIDSPAVCNTGGNPLPANGDAVALTSDGVAGTFTSVAYSPTFTPSAIGRYCFRAVYGGSNAYDGSSDSAANECFTVTTTSSANTFQRWLPNDRIVVSSAGQSLAGTLTVTLRSGTCAGSVVYTDANAVAFTATTAGTVYQTSNTSVFVGTNPDGTPGLAAGTYVWNVTFAPTSSFATGFTKCETSTVAINNNP